MTISAFESRLLMSIVAISFLTIYLICSRALDKRVKTLFFEILILEVLSLVFGELENWTASFSYFTVLRTIFAIMCYTIRPILLCLIILLQNRNEMNWKRKLVLFIPAIINFVLVSTALFSGIVFSYSESNACQRGPLGHVTLVVAMLYLAVFMSFVIFERKKKDKKETLTAILIIIYIIVAAFINLYTTTNGIDKSIIFGTVLYFICFQTDKMEEKIKMEKSGRKKAEKESRTDGLTGLLNKWSFIEQVKSYQEQNPKGKSVLLFIDIDKFKEVNDTYGHLSGDSVIKEVGNVLRDSVRESDLVGRFGGDEFCVLIKEVSSATAQKMLDRLLENACHDYVCGKKTISVSISIGACRFANNMTLEKVMEEADKSLYKAKTIKSKRYLIKEIKEIKEN